MPRNCSRPRPERTIRPRSFSLASAGMPPICGSASSDVGRWPPNGPTSRPRDRRRGLRGHHRSRGPPIPTRGRFRARSEFDSDWNFPGNRRASPPRGWAAAGATNRPAPKLRSNRLANLASFMNQDPPGTPGKEPGGAFKGSHCYRRESSQSTALNINGKAIGGRRSSGPPLLNA